MAWCASLSQAFVIPHSMTARSSTPLKVSRELEPPPPTQKEDDNDDNDMDQPTKGRNIPRTLRISNLSKKLSSSSSSFASSSSSATGSTATAPPTVTPLTITTRGRQGGNGGDPPPVQFLDLSSYESTLIDSWEQQEDAQRGFDWEIEKLRRYFAGLRMKDDGQWIQHKKQATPWLSNYLVQPPVEDPTPPTTLDVAKVVVANVWTTVSQKPFFGGATPVPTALIQKYEGSFFSFIKGVLGGDLQTLAGGPLFLLLNKYFATYGPIFNLSL